MVSDTPTIAAVKSRPWRMGNTRLSSQSLPECSIGVILSFVTTKVLVTMMSYVRSDYLLEPQDLAERLSEESLRVFDATVSLVPAEKGYRAESGLAAYEEGHIPGAAFFAQSNRLANLLGMRPNDEFYGMGREDSSD